MSSIAGSVLRVSRSQGRPAQGTAQVGPLRVVAGTLQALRQLNKSQLSRNDIARFSGVTPALVSYYFPDRTELILAATTPVVDAYATRFFTILASRAQVADKLKKLVVILLECNLNDPWVIEAYRRCDALSAQLKLRTHLLRAMSEAGKCFLGSWTKTIPECPYDEELIWNVMTGMCKNPIAPAQSTARDIDETAELITGLLVAGVERGFRHNSTHASSRPNPKPSIASCGRMEPL